MRYDDDKSENDEEFVEYFRTDRTAEITITERNFRAENVVAVITKDGATVEIILPYAGKLADEENAKTVVTLDDLEMTAAKNGLVVTKSTVSFNAPHFSKLEIVNKYRLTFNAQYTVNNIVNPFATTDMEFADYYTPGETLKFDLTITDANLPTGLAFEKTEIKGSSFSAEAFGKDSDDEDTKIDLVEVEFKMPAEPVTVTSVLKTIEYQIHYYYADYSNYDPSDSNTLPLFKHYSVSYNIFTHQNLNLTEEAWIESLRATPAGGNTAPGFVWYGGDDLASKLFIDEAPEVHLYWINPNETKITVEFLDDNDAPVTSFERTINEWEDFFFEDLSGHIISDDILARLISMPNVIVTSHQAFLTEEALENIADTTVKNIVEFFEKGECPNELCYRCGNTEDCKIGKCF